MLIRGEAVFFYRNPDGSFGWRHRVRNSVTYQGVNWLLDTGFGGLAQVQPVYASLIGATGFTEATINDTHSSHSGWTEWTAISPSVRPIWTPLPANGGLLGTSLPAHFVFTASGNLRGAALSTDSILGSTDSSKFLYNTVVTVSDLPVLIAGTLDVSFALRIVGD